VYRDAADIRHGFVQSKGKFMTIDVPGARCPDGTSVTGINDRRGVVGTSVDAGGDRHGFILGRGKDMTVDVPADLGSETAVFSVNTQGEIVGEQTDAATPGELCGQPERSVSAAHTPSLPGCRARSAGAGSNGYNEGDALAEMVCREDAASELAAVECAGRDPPQVHRAYLTIGHGGRSDPVVRRSDR
jgi:probable HAF family extracellular repeat protein